VASKDAVAAARRKQFVSNGLTLGICDGLVVGKHDGNVTTTTEGRLEFKWTLKLVKQTSSPAPAVRSSMRVRCGLTMDIEVAVRLSNGVNVARWPFHMGRLRTWAWFGQPLFV
jgi:hypothetical protein